MRKIILKSLLAVSVTAVTGNAFAIIPVTDAASILQASQEYVNTATRWREEIQQYETNYSNQLQQLAAQTGVTDITSLVQQTESEVGSLKDIEGYLANPQQILEEGYSSLSSTLQASYNKMGVGSYCVAYTDPTQLKNCQGKIVIDVLRQARNQTEADQVDDHYKAIKAISGKMKIAKTAKEASDYNNALQVQLALLQADKQAMDIQQSNDLEQSSIQEKRSESDRIANLQAEKTTFDNSWGTDE